MAPRQQEVFDQLCAVLLEIEFGNPGMDDTCPMCGMIRKSGHVAFCRIGKAVRALEELRTAEQEPTP